MTPRTPLAYVVDRPEDAAARERPPAVLLHGFARSGWFWRDWVPTITAQRPLIRIDLRGCGASPDPGPGHRFTTEELVADVLTTLTTVAPGGVHLAGESAGGMITAHLAAEHPEIVHSAGLISTPVRPAGADVNVKGAGFGSTEEALAELGLRGWWLRSRELGGELTGDRARDEELADQLARTPVHVALALWDWIHDASHDLHALAPTVRVPVLVMAPGTSHGTNAAQQDRLVELLPDARMVRYADLNHEMYYLHPERLAADYAEFAAAVDAGALASA
jgi:3-oxoadipate enol-lactonase